MWSLATPEHLRRHEVDTLACGLRLNGLLGGAAFGAALPDPALASAQPLKRLPSDQPQTPADQQENQKMLGPKRHAYRPTTGNASMILSRSASIVGSKFASI